MKNFLMTVAGDNRSGKNQHCENEYNQEFTLLIRLEFLT